VLARVRSRFDRGTVGRILQTALAAGIAWEVALRIPGHGQPFFAPIAATIALAAERGRRGRQAVQMMTGVSVGILVGATFVWAFGEGAWQLVIVTALTLALAIGAGSTPLIRTQATVSAILVVALHNPGTNVAWQRLADALIGGSIAIVLARFLFPIDPLALVREQARAVRAALASALDDLAEAIDRRDIEHARRALDAIDDVDDGRLDEALSLAREVSRAAPRRRPLRQRVEQLGVVAHELAASVSDARAMATGAIRVLDGTRVPAEAAETVRATAAAVRAIDPDDARTCAEEARAAARRLRGADSALGSNVLAHGAAGVADHTERAAEAREEDRRLAEARRTRFDRLRVQNHIRHERDGRD
jgi:uncharacterized membrane protein YgaE (UPF0421/DUF939 family)